MRKQEKADTDGGAFPDHVRFAHSWREYQRDVLAQMDAHLEDGRLHVVAPPGSGKTILGLEAVRRLGHPALILSPTVTIRNQWLDRFREHFAAVAPESFRALLSLDAAAPGLLTSITYQALFQLTGERDDDGPEGDAVDEQSLTDAEPCTVARPGLDSFVESLNRRGVKTLVLDEAHHLRRAWWKALDALCAAMPGLTIISLTATPPYDVPPQEWLRYQQLCGPVDAEIPVPELVRAGDLCPHQDIVWYTRPAREERELSENFYAARAAYLRRLHEDAQFVQTLARHPLLAAPEANASAVLEQIMFCSAMMVFLHAAGRELPGALLRLTGLRAKDVPFASYEWYEYLLQSLLYEDDWFQQEMPDFVRAARKALREFGAVEGRRVRLRSNGRLERMLKNSSSKLDAVRDIMRAEWTLLGESLRMVILCDYVRADAHGPEARQPGVVPVFNMLCADIDRRVRQAVLCGTLVVLPHSVRDEFMIQARAAGCAEADISWTDSPGSADYAEVSLKGAHSHRLVALVTILFGQGHVQVLTGTAALLGEGWDAPAVNSLVILGNVGSYMLSNQMRGRAIRSERGNPAKTALIWHPVCVDSAVDEPGADYEVVCRRFDSFMGVDAGGLQICSGIGRLGQTLPAVDDTAPDNAAALACAARRARLPEDWRQAIGDGTEHKRLARMLRTAYSTLPRRMVFVNALTRLAAVSVLAGVNVAARSVPRLWAYKSESGFSLLVALTVLGVLAAMVPGLVRALRLAVVHGPVSGSLRQIGLCVAESLVRCNEIHTPRAGLDVRAEKDGQGSVVCELAGASPHESAVFLSTLREVLAPVQNPNWLLTRDRNLLLFRQRDYHAVPQIIGRKKQQALYFHRLWCRHVGPSVLYNTRTPEGRLQLVRARVRSLAAALADPAALFSSWRG